MLNKHFLSSYVLHILLIIIVNVNTVLRIGLGYIYRAQIG